MKLFFQARDLFLKSPKNKRGYSLLEILIASSIMMTNLGVISTTIIQYGEVSRKQKVITLAMDLESALHRAVADPGTYNDVIIDDLVFNSTFNASFELRPEVGGTTIAINAFPYSQYFTSTLQACADFTVDNCVIHLEVARDTIDAAARVFAFAYRIRINPSLQIKVANLGKEDDTAFVSPTDYLLYVPQFLLMSATAARTECSLTNTAGLTGFNKITGESICLRQPAVGDACAPTQIAKGLMVQQLPLTLQFRCVTPTTWQCPDPNATSYNAGAGTNRDYSLHRFNPKSFDPAFTPTVAYTGSPNQCVFTSQNPTSVSRTVLGRSSVQTTNGPCPTTGTASPVYSNTSTSCAYNNVVINNGLCTPCNTWSVFYSTCTAWGAQIVYPGAGYTTTSGTNPASCGINIPAPPAACQQTGSVINSYPTVTADITITPNCTLTVQEFPPL